MSTQHVVSDTGNTATGTLCGRCAMMDRRDFLEQIAAIIGVAGVAACAPSTTNITTFTVRLADYPTLATNGGLAVVDNGSKSGQPIAVTRVDASTYLALSLVCPHRGFTVEIAGAAYYCPGHGAMFAADGTWTGGQRTSSLSRFPLTYDAADGTLTIG